MWRLFEVGNWHRRKRRARGCEERDANRGSQQKSQEKECLSLDLGLDLDWRHPRGNDNIKGHPQETRGKIHCCVLKYAITSVTI